MLMMLPLPWACMARTSCFMIRTTPRTLVSNVAAKLPAVWSVIGPTWPSVAALFTATSRRPNRATVLSTIARTSSSLRTSALMNSASEPKERSSLTSALPASSRRPATTTFAPFLAKATAVARPMPVNAPVISTTGLLIPHLLVVCSPCRVWREAVSGVKLEPAVPGGRLTAQTLRRFDGSPKVVDATLQDIDKQRAQQSGPRGPDSKANRGPDGCGIGADRQYKKSLSASSRTQHEPTAFRSFGRTAFR